MTKRMMIASACVCAHFAIAASAPQNVPELQRCADESKTSTTADKYGFVFFRNNGQNGVYLAKSADGLNWKEANGGNPVLPAVLDDRITRDPSVCLGPDGVYHIVFTTSWKHRGFGVAHSKDLLTWSTPEFVPINEDWPGARNTWAPEIVWDDAQKLYVIVWATQSDARGHRQYYTTTSDFKTWSPRKLYYDPGHSVIDSFPFIFNGKWHLIAKDETDKPIAKKHLRVVRSKGGVCGPWEPEDAPFTDNAKFWAEGPTVLQLDDGNWVIYFDCYNKGHYGAVVTRDFKSFRDTPFTLPKGIRHGTAFRLK